MSVQIKDLSKEDLSLLVFMVKGEKLPLESTPKIRSDEWTAFELNTAMKIPNGDTLIRRLIEADLVSPLPDRVRIARLYHGESIDVGPPLPKYKAKEEVRDAINLADFDIAGELSDVLLEEFRSNLKKLVGRQ